MFLFDRIVVDGVDKAAWKAARPGRIGASDAMRYAKMESVESYVAAKISPPWEGNQYSDHGHAREVQILTDHGFTQNLAMFHAEGNPRHTATPDAIVLGEHPRFVQVKATKKDFLSKRTGEVLIPSHYRRQLWWEMYVGGPEYTQSTFLYEQYDVINGQLVPRWDSVSVTLDRDDAEIAKMIRIANEVLLRLDLINEVPF